MLDARNPSSTESMQNTEAESTAAEDKEVAKLLHETRIWRLANSAQWVAWGIVQAKVPGIPDFSRPVSAQETPRAVANISASREQMTPTDEKNEVELLINGETQNGVSADDDAAWKNEVEAIREDIRSKRPDPVEENDEAEEEEFDYLAYARDRAMFFWGDALKLGLVEESELPEDVVKNAKTMDY